jgi:hypothetical protein
LRFIVAMNVSFSDSCIEPSIREGVPTLVIGWGEQMTAALSLHAAYFKEVLKKGARPGLHLKSLGLGREITKGEELKKAVLMEAEDAPNEETVSGDSWQLGLHSGRKVWVSHREDPGGATVPEFLSKRHSRVPID